SAALREVLTAQLSLLDQVVGQARAPGRSAVAAAQVRSRRAARAQRRPGVYVYSLPIYLEHPVDAASGRTLLKVGHSSVDVFTRVSGQSRTTALPEDPVLLRIFACDSSDSAGVESKF